VRERTRQHVADAPGQLRAKLTDNPFNEMAAVSVVIEHAERAAFVRTALAVKLRELDAACEQRDHLQAEVNRLAKECRDLADACQADDDDLRQSVTGRLRRTTP
jgi:DNA-binding transcriptional regulator PaaX